MFYILLSILKISSGSVAGDVTVVFEMYTLVDGDSDTSQNCCTLVRTLLTILIWPEPIHELAPHKLDVLVFP